MVIITLYFIPNIIGSGVGGGGDGCGIKAVIRRGFVLRGHGVVHCTADSFARDCHKRLSRAVICAVICGDGGRDCIRLINSQTHGRSHRIVVGCVLRRKDRFRVVFSRIAYAGGVGVPPRPFAWDVARTGQVNVGERLAIGRRHRLLVRCAGIRLLNIDHFCDDARIGVIVVPLRVCLHIGNASVGPLPNGRCLPVDPLAPTGPTFIVGARSVVHRSARSARGRNAVLITIVVVRIARKARCHSQGGNGHVARGHGEAVHTFDGLNGYGRRLSAVGGVGIGQAGQPAAVRRGGVQGDGFARDVPGLAVIIDGVPGGRRSGHAVRERDEADCLALRLAEGTGVVAVGKR